MKYFKFVILIFCFLNSFVYIPSIFSQKEKWNWVCGLNFTLDFNTIDTIPKVIFNDGFFGGGSFYHNSSSISDSAGKLLFFNGTSSDGYETNYYVSNWNKFYKPMDNSQHSVKMHGVDYLIINFPGKRNLYYSIKTGWATIGPNSKRTSIAYDIVDMNKNNGEGSVIFKMPQSLDQFPDKDDSGFRKAIALKHENNLETWVVATFNSAEYQGAVFKCYLFTDKGIKDTIITLLQRNNMSPWLLNSSSDGKLVVSSYIYDDTEEIFISRFNNKTGTLSRYKSFIACDSCFIISAVFSPDASKLYTVEDKVVTEYDQVLDVYRSYINGNNIYQYDLNKPTSEIPNSKKQIGPSITWNYATYLKNKYSAGAFGDLQLSPDGKIYISRIDTNLLSVIENPNEQWEKVSYIDKYINLGKGKVSLRFPLFCDNYYNTHLSIISDSVFCEGDSLVIEAGLSDNTYKSSYIWTGPKGEIYNTSKITIANCNSSHSGNYQLVVDVNGAKLHDSIKIKILPNPPPEIQGSKEAFLKTTKNYSTTENKDYQFHWEVNGGRILTNSNLSRISVQWDSVGSGLVKLTQTNIKTGCVGSSQLDVIVRDFPKAEISGDTTACEGDTVMFKTFSNENLSYFWILRGLRAIGAMNEANITLVCDSAGYGYIRLIRNNKLTDKTDTADFELLIYQRPAKPELKQKADTILETVPG